METEIIVSLITLAGSAIGTFCGIAVNGKLTNYRLEQLEKKQDLHNNAVIRLYEVERRLEVDEERIKVANHRIKDLEKGRS